MPSACFRNVCKQIAKMHEAIFDLLPEEQTQVSLRAQSLFILKVQNLCLCFTLDSASCSFQHGHGWALMKVFFCTGAVSED